MNILPFLTTAALAASAIGQLHAAEPVMTWSQTYDSGLTYGAVSDYPRKVKVDDAGNVIVLGNAGSEWVVLKYLPDGSASWTNRFRGSDPRYGSASGYGLAVDPAGNVLVTGFSSAAVIGTTLTTVKYLPNGTAAWTNVFSGTGYGVATDGSGNVYVAGSSGAFGTGTDFITMKYQPDGTPVWTNRFNGPGSPSNDSDDVRTLAVDAVGNVLVTGTSQIPGQGSDFATVKYLTDGTAAWTNYFSSSEVSFDAANDLAVDRWGNAYVTGFARGTSDVRDYLTIKYQSDGTPVWTNRFNRLGNGRDMAFAVRVDDDGNTYVQGTSAGENYAVIKYNPDGTAIWTNLFKGAYEAEYQGIELDSSGNVFMAAPFFGNGTGPDIAVIKYSSNGTAVWTNRFSGPGNATDTPAALAVDHAGKVYVTGDSAGDIVTLQYAPGGAKGWTNLYATAQGGNDTVVKAVADAAGNIYVIGGTWGFGTASDYLTIKFQKDGTPVWTNRYDAGEHNLDEARDIAVDGAGNVYVTGNSRNNPADRDDPGYLTIKYLTDGTPAWTNRFNPTPTVDNASGVVVDKVGNVFVTGTTGHGDDATTIKYRPDGTTDWVRRYRGGEYGTYAYAIALDSVGSVCVAGHDHSNGDYRSWFAIKYQSNGLTLWTNRFSSGGASDAYGIAVDNNNNVYVTGASSPYNTDGDYLTIKYQPDGTSVWTNRYNGPPNGSDVAQFIAVDKAGNAHVSGLSGLALFSNAGADYATIKYQSDGTPAWTNRYDGPAGLFDAASDVAVDDKGNVFVTGRSTGAGTYIDHATIKYRPDGTAAWTNRLSGALLAGSDTAASILPLASGDIVVVGSIATADGSSDWFLYRLAESPEPNQVSLALLDEQTVRIRFAGVSGQSYQVQRAPSVNGPWTVLSTLTAPAHGLIEYVDSDRPPEGAFYRTARP